MTVEAANCRASVHTLQCLDIWSGNEAIHNAISVPGIDVWISSTPYKGDSRGGDIHYISMCRCQRISRFAIADVAGHGEAVGALAHRLRSLMRQNINTPDQTRFAQALNQEFSKLQQHGLFATAVLATYFPPTNHLIICNAGHPRPLWYHATSCAWELLDYDIPQQATKVSNLPLGIIDHTDYHQFAIKLEKGDLVLIYTDSLMEARSSEGKELGEQGLLDIVRRLYVDQPQNLNQEVLAQVTAYHGQAPPNDDQTLLVLHHNAAEPPKMSAGQKVRVMAKMLGMIGD